MEDNNGDGREAHVDVQMEDAGDLLERTEPPQNGHGSVDETTVLDSVEQPASGHTYMTFAVKPDPDASQGPSSPPIDTAKMVKKSGPKKRGTAASKRGGKRPKSAKKAAKKRSAKEDGEVADEDSSDDEIDNGPYCLCRGPDDHRWMISCDVCNDWFHGECVNIEKQLGEKLIERFVCPLCTDMTKGDYTKYKKTCSLDGCTNPARLYGKQDRSVFCCNEHCDSWWTSMVGTLPSAQSSLKAVEALTQEDFMGLLASSAEKGGWVLGEAPFGDVEGLWTNGLPTRPGVLSDEDQLFLQNSAAERLALGNEIVQYKKMMQLLDWATERRQAAIEKGTMSKDSCGYDWRLDTVSVRFQFAAFLESPEGQAVFNAGKLDTPIEPGDGDPSTRGMCEKKKCAPHKGWYKTLLSGVRVLINEATMAAAEKLEAEQVLRHSAEVRFQRRQLENNTVTRVPRKPKKNASAL